MTHRIAILGCGYVGRAVAQHWRSHGCSITATTTTPERIEELEHIVDRALVLHGSDTEAVRSLVANHDILLVTVGAGRGHSYEETYWQTAQTIATVLKETPPKETSSNETSPDTTSLRQIIYTSSYAIYGHHQGTWVTEETPIKPATAKAEILAQTEQTLLACTTAHLNVCIFRLAGIYGPDRELDRIFRSLAGKTQPGDGSEASNWIHRDDITGAIVFAHAHQLNGIYNLVNDTPLSRRELLQWVCQTYQLEPVKWDSSQPSQRATNVRLSNQKLKTAGYALIHPQL